MQPLEKPQITADANSIVLKGWLEKLWIWLTSLLYTEGSWTPVIQGSTTNGSYNYITQQGRYTKIGTLVVVEFEIAVLSITTAATGNLRIGGLPFPVRSAATPGTFWTTLATGWNVAPVAGTQIVSPGSSYLDLLKVASTTTWNRTNSAPSDIAANCDLVMAGYYYAS